ncbi:apoptosis-stimulating of p53 protein 1 isoform X2 [Cimex lectularius]|uniref:SH3 domain-containing protein n=1 Tax=Cimex lectularius TaxID=79782 RepID=A0A8I6RC60_CIMLE|nr:apoptosis-stimulating of p53 protein 1 isoform X2 [Cimex lectularius]
MVPLILRVVVEQGVVDVPLTPDTTCRDVIDCVRDPGEEHCTLVHTWGNYYRALSEGDRPLEILHKWGPARDHVTFTLKYTFLNSGGKRSRNGMKEADFSNDPVRSGGVELTVVELEAMAVRQEEEMASQRQLLVAKEQRLRYLKEHEVRHAQVAQETERLRRLRDRVDAQELKLSKLRALRGQVDHGKATNQTLTSDLDSIRALFNEKEKELTVAVAKVEELTRQLEDVRRGKQAQPPSNPVTQELDRLRRELMYRNKLNEQQTARLSEQREVLCQRQLEMASIDKRIAELQERLHRKRVLNQQLANQITAASNKANVNQHQNRGVEVMGIQQQNMFHLGNNNSKQMLRSMPSGNIAAVEPYHHVPTYPSQNLDDNYMKQNEINKVDKNTRYNTGNQEEIMGPRKQNLTAPATHHYIQETKKDDKQQHVQDNEVSSFGASKSDPKYQTLPYNTKFTGNIPSSAMQLQQQQKLLNKRVSAEGNENCTDNIESAKTNMNNNNLNLIINNNMLQQQIVHSIPIQSSANKGLAMVLANQKQSSSPTSSTSSYSSTSQFGQRVYSNNLLNSTLIARGQPVGGTSSTTSSTSSLATSSSNSSVHQVSSTLASGLPSQTGITSRLALPPTPLISDTQVVLKEETETSKPALPPKPAMPVKPTPPPPPRQSQNSVEVTTGEVPETGLTVLANSQQLSKYDEPPPLPTTDPPPEDATSKKLQENIIKARPLTLKKQPVSDLPKLKAHRDEESEEKRPSEELKTEEENLQTKGSPGSEDSDETSHGTRNGRRIEMPPEFLFPETEAPPADLIRSPDQTDRGLPAEDSDLSDTTPRIEGITRRAKKGNLKGCSQDKQSLSRRVSFDPLALLLDASLEGELELVTRTAGQVRDPSAANDEGITALHNAICAGHFDIVTFLVKFGCDVNAQDSDGWTPLHCAASCNNVSMVRFLVEHGACIFATTLSDHETAAEKCEEDEEGFDGCSEYLYSVQEKLGIMNNGAVFAVFDYEAHNPDELNFKEGDELIVLRKGDEWEREWWWARLNDKEGYIPKNLLGLYPRVHPNKNHE